MKELNKTKQDYCLGFIFTTDGKKVVLIEKQKPAWQRGFLNGIGGKVEENEEFVEAMIRECHEETGVNISRWINYAKMTGEWGTVEVFKSFVNDDVFNQIKTMESEEVTSIEVSLVDKYPLLDSVRYLIPLALQQEQIYAVINY